MTHPARHLALLAVLAALGCQAVGPAPVQPRPRATSRAAALTEVTGQVRLPARLIGVDGGTLIGIDGGSLIGVDGGSLVGVDGGTLAGPRARRLLAVGEPERPLSGARVFLADPMGRALPGLPPVRTDGGGQFSLRRVPAGLTYVVVVEAPTRAGKVARLTSLASTHAGAAVVRVGLGSTMVTAAMVADPARGMGRVDNGALQAMAMQVEQQLDLAKLPDMTDATAVKEAAQALMASDPALQRQAATMQQALGEAAMAPQAMAQAVEQELAVAADAEASGGVPPASPLPSDPAGQASGVVATPTPAESARAASYDHSILFGSRGVARPPRLLQRVPAQRPVGLGLRCSRPPARHGAGQQVRGGGEGRTDHQPARVPLCR
ncbi:MAG: carboxypeptidase-like regulatory domain-containing protein [Candidatus Sericytochromatia bacterium]|nr:carboxypeptidase-like regulatory domain-containing protein [Candidatus Sericytochromatia bacterium]